jgi:2-hydroxychromene-2-carboxylate isomerase
LAPVRWPEPFPGNTLFAMRAASYAKQIGRTVAFSLAAFRQAFAAGRDLTDPDNVLLAAAAAEIHPRALLAAVERDSVKAALREATERAGDLGALGVPTVIVDGRVFWGDDKLDEAAAIHR